MGHQSHPTSYDPLDLFSEDEDRITRAIEALWNAWIASEGAVNNLRISTAGHIITPSDAFTPSGNLAFDLDAASIGSRQGLAPGPLKQSFARALLPLITQTDLISSIGVLQSSLDPLDIEGLTALWTRVHGVGIPLGSGEPEPNLDDWVAFAKMYRSEGLKIDEDNPTKDQLRHHILAYLMSATFKDCSVILRFPGPLSAEEGGKPSIAVIDLDPKSIRGFANWARLDRHIAQTYAARCP